METFLCPSPNACSYPLRVNILTKRREHKKKNTSLSSHPPKIISPKKVVH